MTGLRRSQSWTDGPWLNLVAGAVVQEFDFKV